MKVLTPAGEYDTRLSEETSAIPKPPIVIETVLRSKEDIKALSSITIDEAAQVDDHFDYSGIVVEKPWGYEYLFKQTKDTAIWILYIKTGCKTSMHCHPNKGTSLMVLSGSVEVHTLKKDYFLVRNDGLHFEKGVFHQTTSTDPVGSYVMEVESPVNKRDLVRLSDLYGREKAGYEDKSHYKSMDEFDVGLIS